MLRVALLSIALLVVGCGSTTSPTPSAPSTPARHTPTATDRVGPTRAPAPPTMQAATPIPSPDPPAATTNPTEAPAPTATPEPSRWVRAGAFSSPRLDTQLAVLGNGQVLAAGDEPTCGIESRGSATAEIWRPRTGRWRRTDSMSSARTLTTLVALDDGRAMVTGGANKDYVAKSSTVIYDPATHRWSDSGLLNTARMEFAAATLSGGGVLVAGGLLITKRQDGRALRSAEQWDPASGRWTEVEPMAAVRKGPVAVTLADGRILVVGGYPSWGAGRPLPTAEIYNPRTGHWRAAGRLSTSRDLFTLVALPDGGALVVGGSRFEDWAERFDAASRTWAPVPGHSPIGQRPAAAVVGDGRVLVVSGKDARLWNPARSRWSRTATLPGGMWEASAVVLKDGSVLVGGGWTVPAAEGETPGCPAYSSRTWRFIPGS